MTPTCDQERCGEQSVDLNNSAAIAANRTIRRRSPSQFVSENMKKKLTTFIAATVLVAALFASAKTLNPPGLTIDRAIEIAREFVKAEDFDVSRHFLVAVQELARGA